MQVPVLQVFEKPDNGEQGGVMVGIIDKLLDQLEECRHLVHCPFGEQCTDVPNQLIHELVAKQRPILFGPVPQEVLGAAEGRADGGDRLGQVIGLHRRRRVR
jgi:hypothetical protein